ncbi:MAG: PD-(D/E)XK nuclease domain-containing protein [Desulfovibrio sp.]|jgi:hypothetical protein|nr:PD-(D/E)XK nuclease domain-containing protein [Desulfovibrio sp.]
MKHVGLDIRPEEHKLFGRADLVLYHSGKQILFELKVSKTGTRRSLQEEFREAKGQLDGYVRSYKNPIPIGIVVSGTLRRIALTSVNADVYECPPDADGREAASFNRIGDVNDFLASPWESSDVDDA